MRSTLLWLFALGFLSTINGKDVICCPSNFVLVGKKCYFFSPERQTWQNAYWKCDTLNSTLAVINKAAQDDLLRKYLNKFRLGEYERWIGGIYDWKQMKWKWGVSEKPMKYKGFPRSKREDQNLQWHCITIDPLIQNRWNSGKCILSKHYICQTDVIHGTGSCTNRTENCSSTFRSNSHNASNDFMNAEPAFINVVTGKRPTIYACKGGMVLLGNKCYTFSDRALSWNEADWACRENRTRLAVVRKRGQDQKLKRFLNQGFVEKRERWLGGMYDWQKKVWRWALSGAVVQYSNFTKTHPKDPMTLRWHCITVDPTYKNEWSSSVCAERRHFICQTKAATVKLGERRKKKQPKKSSAEVVIKLEKKGNGTKEVEYRFRSGIETSVELPRGMWGRYGGKRVIRYPKIAPMSSRRNDGQL